MIGFNWLKALKVSSEEPSEVKAPTLEQQILWLCQRPITLGELSDRLQLDYRQLTAVLVELLALRRIRTVYLLKEGLFCVHYVVYEHPTT